MPVVGSTHSEQVKRLKAETGKNSAMGTPMSGDVWLLKRGYLYLCSVGNSNHPMSGIIQIHNGPRMGIYWKNRQAFSDAVKDNNDIVYLKRLEAEQANALQNEIAHLKITDTLD